MCDCGFGRIENMPVRNGQPLLDEKVRVVRVARFCGGAVRRTPPSSSNFEVKRAVVYLLKHLMQLDNVTVLRLEFRQGLPFLLETLAEIPR